MIRIHPYRLKVWTVQRSFHVNGASVKRSQKEDIWIAIMKLREFNNLFFLSIVPIVSLSLSGVARPKNYENMMAI